METDDDDGVERSGMSVVQQGLKGPLGNLLERFRRSGGVPAAAGIDLASELAPVFAALDEIESEADSVRREAEAERAARKAQLEQDLDAIAEDARVQADRERDGAFESARRAAEADATRIRAEGEHEATAIREIGKDRLPRLVEDVVTRIVGEER